jgi:NAD dependent epimerase/dehydratase family enzyme
MHLIITGATGMIGTTCLHEMLVNKRVTKVSILSRKPVAMADGHSKANVVLHQDFSRFESETLEKLKGAEGCVWALGASVNEVSKESVCCGLFCRYVVRLAD